MSKTERPYRNREVAILATGSAGAVGEIIYGFRMENEHAAQSFVPFFYFNLGMEYLGIEIGIRKALEEKHSVLFCVGPRVTSVAYKLTKDMQNPPAIVFCGTIEPVELGLIASEDRSGNHLCGIEFEERPPIAQFAEIFSTMLPRAKKIYLPSMAPSDVSDPDLLRAFTAWHRANLEPFLQVMREKDIIVEESVFSHGREAVDTIELHGASYDAIVLLEGNPILDLHGPIGTVCSQLHVPLCANLYAGVQCSAAFGFALSLSLLGRAAAQYAQRIIFKNTAPTDLPLHRVSNFTRSILINDEIAHEQRVDVLDIESFFDIEVKRFHTRASWPPARE